MQRDDGRMRTAYVRAVNLHRVDEHNHEEFSVMLADTERIVGADIRCSLDDVQRAVVYVVSDPEDQSELGRHHRDFQRISSICEEALAAEVGYMGEDAHQAYGDALSAIRGIVG